MFVRMNTQAYFARKPAAQNKSSDRHCTHCGAGESPNTKSFRDTPGVKDVTRNGYSVANHTCQHTSTLCLSSNHRYLVDVG